MIEPIEVTLRAASHADLDAIVTLEAASQPSPWPRALFEDELRRDVASVVVAVDVETGAIAGALVFWLVVDEAHILNVTVAPPQRRRGVGSRLVAWAVERATAGGAAVLLLEVRETNQGARRLYDQFGFQEIARRAGYYADSREAAIVLARRTDEAGSTSALWMERRAGHEYGAAADSSTSISARSSSTGQLGVNHRRSARGTRSR